MCVCVHPRHSQCVNLSCRLESAVDARRQQTETHAGELVTVVNPPPRPAVIGSNSHRPVDDKCYRLLIFTCFISCLSKMIHCQR